MRAGVSVCVCAVSHRFPITHKCSEMGGAHSHIWFYGNIDGSFNNCDKIRQTVEPGTLV